MAAFGGALAGVDSVCLNAAERHVGAGTAAMVINTRPVLIAILAGLFLRCVSPASPWPAGGDERTPRRADRASGGSVHQMRGACVLPPVEVG
jgi:hypothetical protein